MTNKEAIEILKKLPDCIIDISVPVECCAWEQALDLAIKALERDGTLSYDEVITSVFSCPVCGAIWRDKETEE